MRASTTYSFFNSLIFLLLLISVSLKANSCDVLDRIIKLPKSKETVYNLLEKVSKQSGFLFIYDSELINNEKEVKLSSRKLTIRQAIHAITGNNLLELRIIGNHILITCPTDTTKEIPLPSTTMIPDSIRYLTLKGQLLDRYTKEPIPNSTISIAGTSLGSVANQNGEFRLVVPDSLRESEICFTHVGYKQETFNILLLSGQNCTLTLEPKVIPLQEVIIRASNPIRLLQEIQKNRLKNYSQKPAYLTTFYREGIEWKSKFVSLTEAIFKVYKAPYDESQSKDRMKLLKMRRIINDQERDTLVTKMKSGINACFILDLIKNTPDFLDTGNTDIYMYTSSDLTMIDNRLVHIIHFEQKEHITTPFYRGELYIDSENSALLSACFEYHPTYLNQGGYLFVERKSRDITIVPQKVTYTVSYKSWNGLYYIHHIRGDLHFKVKKKKQLFGNTALHTWFEMVTCQIDTTQVNRIPRKETMPSQTVFAETNFRYDDRFWDSFNVIPPEEALNEAIGKISIKIEDTDY